MSRSGLMLTSSLLKDINSSSIFAPGKVGVGSDWPFSPQALPVTLPTGNPRLLLRRHPSHSLPLPLRSTTMANYSGGVMIPAKSPPLKSLRQQRKHRRPSQVALPSPATSQRGRGLCKPRYLYDSHRIRYWPSRDPIGEEGESIFMGWSETMLWGNGISKFRITPPKPQRLRLFIEKLSK